MLFDTASASETHAALRLYMDRPREILVSRGKADALVVQAPLPCQGNMIEERLATVNDAFTASLRANFKETVDLPEKIKTFNVLLPRV